MRVIDSHVHFPEDRIIDDGRPRGAAGSGGVGYTSGRPAPGAAAKAPSHPWLEAEKARWEAAWRFPAAAAVGLEEGERLWRAEVDGREHLKAVVFVTAGSNELAGELAARHPGAFYGYAHHDPLLPDAPERLERALAGQGLRGYKLLGPKIDRRLDDPSFYPLWEIASAHNAPVLIHFGIMGGAGGIANHVNINPIVIHDVAKRFPSLPIIVPHFGCGYVFETLQLCWACPNVYVDTSGSNQWMRWMPYEVSLASLFRKYRETIGATRIIFGTDSSWFPRGFADAYLDVQVREMTDNGYSADEVDAVLYRNIAGLLGI
ncbi:MAG TPA: amidohydrolase family protein [Spirochaetales bacterium]|nr:amidohydrolase family protein [Spirochaetales bacterium]HRY54531.1 amidohydrolase family protein [Spirochaetia bacterium]HRZ66051.1 amidohydrolase family protein [Spirochaetia bacterium]